MDAVRIGPGLGVARGYGRSYNGGCGTRFAQTVLAFFPSLTGPRSKSPETCAHCTLSSTFLYFSVLLCTFSGHFPGTSLGTFPRPQNQRIRVLVPSAVFCGRGSVGKCRDGIVVQFCLGSRIQHHPQYLSTSAWWYRLLFAHGTLLFQVHKRYQIKSSRNSSDCEFRPDVDVLPYQAMVLFIIEHLDQAHGAAGGTPVYHHIARTRTVDAKSPGQIICRLFGPLFATQSTAPIEETRV